MRIQNSSANWLFVIFIVCCKQSLFRDVKQSQGLIIVSIINN